MNTPIARRQLFRFESFEVDTAAHEVRAAGRSIRLQEQPYRVLLILLEHHGEVVTRDELRRRLWPASVLVDFDHGLNNSVARLRQVFGDSPARPRIIATIPRVGYRFIASVTVEELVRDAAGGGSTSTVASVPTVGRNSWQRSRWLWAVIVGAIGLLAVLLWTGVRAASVPPIAALRPATVGPNAERTLTSLSASRTAHPRGRSWASAT